MVIGQQHTTHVKKKGNGQKNPNDVRSPQNKKHVIDMLGGQCINIKLKKNDSEDDVNQTINFWEFSETHQQIKKSPMPLVKNDK